MDLKIIRSLKDGYGMTRPEFLLPYLVAKKNSPEILGLFDEVSGHPLLLHRLNRAWELYSEPMKLANNQQQAREGHRKGNARIYRARNLLVHQGIEVAFLPQLSSQLQHYFSITLSRLLRWLQFGNNWKTRDAAAYWISHADKVVAVLKRSPKELKISDLFPGKIYGPDIQVWEDR